MTATAGDASNATASAASDGGGGKGVTYGKSWADDIQKYHAAKATLPWKPEQQTPLKHVTRYEKSREEREYDLVLGKFRDAEKELKQHANEAERRKHDLENSRARQLRNVQRFNLINHSPMYTGARDPKDPPTEPREPRRTSNVNYNIVTNLTRDGLVSPSPVKGVPASPTSPAARNRRVREFNILTNKYHDRHDQREQDERTQATELAAVKFNKKNNFHPVRIAFYDPDKESKFLEVREKEQQIHGQDRVGKLPPREQFAEGKIYNIVNQNVINPSQIERYDGHAERAKNKMQQHAFETRMLAYGQQLAEKEEQLCLNRFAHERHSQAFVHGFDPITNQPFDGINAKVRVPTRTHAALPAWQVLELGVASTTKIAAALVAKSRKPETTSPSQPESSTTGLSSMDGGSERRPNVLVVDHPAKIETPKRSSSKDAASAIRTGGFGHATQ